MPASSSSSDTQHRRRRVRRRSRILHCKQILDENNLILARHYYKHIHKVPCYTDVHRGRLWMDSLLRGHEIRSLNVLRLEKELIVQLCDVLTNRYNLQSAGDVTTLEKVGIFLFAVSQGDSYRVLSELFQRSTETIHRAFQDVLNSIVGRGNNLNGLARDIIRPRNPNFPFTPRHIRDDRRYRAYFKECIGCIDGTHVSASIPEVCQVPFRDRKQDITYNVLAVCDFDMLFTYILTGWEGSVHDQKVLDNATADPKAGFPHPPPGKYYLVDKGYANRTGFLTPYPRLKYHLQQWEHTAPDNEKEAFNQAHASLRSCIERCFGVLKQRWTVLRLMPSFPVTTQVDIIVACFALHNFIRLNSEYDDIEQYEDPDAAAQEDVGEVDEDNTNAPRSDMDDVRDRIAALIWNDRR